jgi:hypothetical protein
MHLCPWAASWNGYPLAGVAFDFLFPQHWKILSIYLQKRLPETVIFCRGTLYIIFFQTICNYHALMSRSGFLLLYFHIICKLSCIYVQKRLTRQVSFVGTNFRIVFYKWFVCKIFCNYVQKRLPATCIFLQELPPVGGRGGGWPLPVLERGGGLHVLIVPWVGVP